MLLRFGIFSPLKFKRMKKIGILLMMFAMVVSCKSQTKNTKEITTLLIDSTMVRKHLYTLASDKMEGRKAGTIGIERAAQYIENEFKRLGLSTYDTLSSYRQTLTFKNRRTQEDITSSNIIGVLEGTSKKDEIVIISAHYDHLGIRAKKGVLDSIYNGANDDASGVAGVLALAAYFKKAGNERTVV